MCQFNLTGFIGGVDVTGEQEDWKGKNKRWDLGIFSHQGRQLRGSGVG